MRNLIIVFVAFVIIFACKKKDIPSCYCDFPDEFIGKWKIIEVYEFHNTLLWTKYNSNKEYDIAFKEDCSYTIPESENCLEYTFCYNDSSLILYLNGINYPQKIIELNDTILILQPKSDFEPIKYKYQKVK